jgi:hypothetical protein
MIAHCSSAVMRQGAPQRGASLKRSSAEPAEPALASQRPRHWLTVLRQTPKCPAASVMFIPSAKSKIIRAREAAPCAVEGERTKPSRSSLSDADKTSAAAAIPIAILQNESIAIENQLLIALKTKILRVNNPAKVN